MANLQGRVGWWGRIGWGLWFLWGCKGLVWQTYLDSWSAASPVPSAYFPAVHGVHKTAPTKKEKNCILITAKNFQRSNHATAMMHGSTFLFSGASPIWGQMKSKCKYGNNAHGIAKIILFTMQRPISRVVYKCTLLGIVVYYTCTLLARIWLYGIRNNFECHEINTTLILLQSIHPKQNPIIQFQNICITVK